MNADNANPQVHAYGRAAVTLLALALIGAVTVAYLVLQALIAVLLVLLALFGSPS